MTCFSIAVEHRLADFHLSVAFERRARVLAIVGASGAGKTTLLHAVAGLVRPERGRIAIDGTVHLDVAAGVVRPPHRRRIGYVFQDGRLFPHLSVAANLRYGAWFAADKLAGAEEERIVALLGIAPLLRRGVRDLSGGERQRVAIGRALLARPKLLLMDEPFAALDSSRRDELLGLIEAVRDQTGVPVLYVSHNPAEVARLADAVVTLERGRLVA